MSFVISKETIVANALSCKYVLISTLNTKRFGFEHIKELYADDHDFSDEYQACEKAAVVSTLSMMVTYFKGINLIEVHGAF